MNRGASEDLQGDAENPVGGRWLDLMRGSEKSMKCGQPLSERNGGKSLYHNKKRHSVELRLPDEDYLDILICDVYLTCLQLAVLSSLDTIICLISYSYHCQNGCILHL